MQRRLLAKGRTAEVFSWGDGQIVKLFYDWCSPDWIAREARIGAAMAASGLPVPRCYGQVEIAGRSGIVFERLTGPSMIGAVISEPWHMRRYARQFAALQLQINGRPAGDLPDLAGYLRKCIVEADALSDSQKEATRSILDGLDGGDRLCHFDFHPDQVILTADGPRVIDWLTAFKGDPAADVARTTTLMELGSVEQMGLPARMLVLLAKRRFTKMYLAAYSVGCEADVMKRARKWKLPVLAARLSEEVPGEKERILPMVDVLLRRGSP